MHADHCLNCSHSLAGQTHYCTHCGQAIAVHRITIGHLFHELFHAVTHADKGILYLMKGLTLRPARVATEYVEGARKKYFNPFTFLLLCIAVIVIINNLTKPFDMPQPDPAMLQQLTEAQRQMYLKVLHRTHTVMEIMDKHANLVYMTAIPFYAFFIWLFFRKRKRNYAEVVTAMIFFTGYVSVVYSILFTPVQAFYKGTKWFYYLSLIGIVLYALYYAWGLKAFLGFRTKRALVKVFLVTLFAFVLWTLVMGVAMFFYIYGENTWKVLSVLSKKAM